MLREGCGGSDHYEASTARLRLAHARRQAPQARADCYDVFGCTDRNAFRLADLLNGPNCQFLYEMRNRIYAQHGYYFKTPRAIELLGNEGCQTGDVNALGLSRLERANAAMIQRAEEIKGCPR
jgi:hypothetical protein